MTDILGYSVDFVGLRRLCDCRIGTACKNGKEYLCRIYNAPVEPVDNGTFSATAIAKYREIFESFKSDRIRRNNIMREISGIGGNIVCPIDETVYDHHWMEFSEFIEGALPEDQYAPVIASLSDDKKLLVLKIAIGALQTIHGQKIVHGDLKLTNIMLVKNSSGNYTSKIVGFENAFFEDDGPAAFFAGDPDYFSPELAICSGSEDPEERENIGKMITTKSDIFTMGLILHEYLAGMKPEADHLTASLRKRRDAGQSVYPWQVVLSRDKGEERPQLVVSSKITEPAYVALISDMLCVDPERRPDAAEVMKRLNTKEVPIEPKTWAKDFLIINQDVAEHTLVALRTIKYHDADGTVRYGYETVLKDGRRFIKSAEELMDEGLAVKGIADEFSYKIPPKPIAPLTPAAPADVALWPEDDAMKLDAAKAASFRMEFMGKVTMNGINGYQFKMSNGSVQFWNAQKCRMMKILIPK